MSIVEKFRTINISRQLLLISVLITCVCIGITSLVFLIHEYHYYRSDQLNRFLTIAEILDSNLTAPLRFLDPEGADEIISSVKNLSMINGIVVYDSNEEIFTTYKFNQKEDISKHISNENIYVQGLKLYYYKSILINNEVVGHLYIEGNMDQLKDRIIRFAMIVLVMFLVTIFLTLIIGSRLQQRVADPIKSLINISEEIVRKNKFSLRVENESNNDLGEFIERFNLMLKFIEQRDRELLEHHKNLEDKVKKRTLQLEKSKNEAIKASKAKGEFLAVMSHELRTPMNAIVGMTSLLTDTELNSEQRDFTETIHNSSDALLNLINDILDFSKIESGKLELESEPFNIRSCIEESLDFLAMSTSEKWINLGFFIDEDVPAMVSGDRGRLRQILVNLLSNSSKFTEEGEILLNLKKKKLKGNKITLLFSVMDTGIGIPEDKIDQLFQDFTQIDPSITRKYGGTGLGLAICKRLVETMKGKIWVESKPNIGSTFYFTAQFHVHNQRWGQSLYKTQPTIANKTIIVIDEYSSNRKLIQSITEKWGLICHSTGNLESGIQMLKSKNSVDYLIIGISKNIPEPTVLKTLVHKSINNQKTKVILLGQKGIIVDRQNIIENEKILSKPIRPERLLNALLNETSETNSNLETPDPEDEVIAGLKGTKVLLVEDNKVNQKVASLLLKKYLFQLDLASDGNEALQAISSQKYDMVLMDIQMPNMDGITATRHIRKDYPKNMQPWIIALTAHATDDFKEYAMKSGMNGFLIKPIRNESLHKEFQKYIEVKGIIEDDERPAR